MPETIYILVNSSMPNLIKIGRTTRSAQQRATELSQATNMPTSFVVAFEDSVSDGPAAERIIHELLAERGYRVAPNREFFNAPLKTALLVVQEVVLRLPAIKAIEDDEGDCLARDDLLEDQMLQQAMAYFTGDEDTLQDDTKAFEYFQSAASLGSVSAERFLALGYFTGRIGTISGRKALQHLDRATKLGDSSCYKDMWEIYSGQTKATDAVNQSNAELCFKWYLDNAIADADLTDLLDYVSFQHWLASGKQNDDQPHPLHSKILQGQHTMRVLDLVVERLNQAMHECAHLRRQSDNLFSPMGVVYVQSYLKYIFVDYPDYMARILVGLTRTDLRTCFADTKEPNTSVNKFSKYLTEPELSSPSVALPSSENGVSTTTAKGFWKRLFS